MEAIIKDAAAGKSPKEVESLELDAWKGSELTEADKANIERFKKLTFISFKGCGLTSLKNFPTNKQLQEVDLSHNQLSGGLDALTSLKNLMVATLDNNQFSSFQELQPLKVLPQLRIVDLYGNPIAQDADYPGKLFEIFDLVKAVDGHGPNGEEIKEIPLGDDEEDDDEESPAEDDDDYSAEEDDDDDEEDEEEDYGSDEDEYSAKKRPRNARSKDSPQKKQKL